MLSNITCLQQPTNRYNLAIEKKNFTSRGPEKGIDQNTF